MFFRRFEGLQSPPSSVSFADCFSTQGRSLFCRHANLAYLPSPLRWRRWHAAAQPQVTDEGAWCYCTSEDSKACSLFPPHQSAPLTASPPKGEAFFNHRFIYISKRALYKGFRIVYDMRVGTEKTFGAKAAGKGRLDKGKRLLWNSTTSFVL